MENNIKRKKLYLNLVAAVVGIAGVATLVPCSAVSTPSILGYKALCSFSPVSTVILLYIANMIRGYAKRIQTDR